MVHATAADRPARRSRRARPTAASGLGRTDLEIERDIERQLWWSPFVDADQVTVDVEDGVAHLAGTVDTHAERDAASENAFEGGAVFVDNDLLVRYGVQAGDEQK